MTATPSLFLNGPESAPDLLFSAIGSMTTAGDVLLVCLLEWIAGFAPRPDLPVRQRSWRPHDATAQSTDFGSSADSRAAVRRVGNRRRGFRCRVGEQALGYWGDKGHRSRG